MAVKEENKGARKTQTLRMSMVMWKKCRMWYRTADVIISPSEGQDREKLINASFQNLTQHISFLCDIKQSRKRFTSWNYLFVLFSGNLI